MDYLKSQSTTTPDIATAYTDLASYHEKQLWYQFSDRILELLQNDHFNHEQRLYNLYTHVIQPVQFKLNQINLCRFVVRAAAQCKSADEKTKFLNGVHDSILAHIAQLKKLPKVTQNDINEFVYSKLIVSSALIVSQIEQMTDLPAIEAMKQQIDNNVTELNNFTTSVDPYVYSTIYYSQLVYYKHVGPAGDYFNAALNYLTYVQLDEVSMQEQKVLAVDIGTAALLGTNIYNYGELLSHPLVRTLDTDAQSGWLSQLLHTCNDGEINKFEQIYKANASKSNAMQGSDKQAFLFEKVRIMSLINAVFQRRSTERTIEFSEISKVCKVKTEQVEWMLMKALSLGVIKGQISQIAQTIRVTWVQPRVLNAEQVNGIREKLVAWNSELEKNIVFLEQNGAELIKVE